MNILVTGAKGFIGKNLVATLNNIREGKDKTYQLNFSIDNIFEYDVDSAEDELDRYVKECDFVYHLAGINRPQNPEEFMSGNFGFTTTLLNRLTQCSNKSPILMSSSIQADVNNEYGKSKKAGEEYLTEYGIKNGIKTYVFRLPNVFGKWCKPNYNSAIATFCNNIACDLPIKVNNRDTVLSLVYIDDVVADFINAMSDNVKCIDGYCCVSVEYHESLGNIVDTIKGFSNSRLNYHIPNLYNDSLNKKLYSTYLSYLPEDKFGYELKMNVDDRGSFTEFVKTKDFGQVSVNISKPNIVKGNHWHHSKNEKFLVVSGNGVIRFRRVGCIKVIEYFVSGDKLKVIDIPCGYTHNIENLGNSDLVTIMWANEQFDPNKPDTYYLEV